MLAAERAGVSRGLGPAPYMHQNKCPSMLAVPCDARSAFVAGFSEFESLFVEVRDKSVALGPRAACALPDTWVSCHYE